MTEHALQKLLIKRFLFAAATYAWVFVLFWAAVLAGFFSAPVSVAVVGSSLVVLSQLALLVVFLTGLNKRFVDASLTEFQVLLGLAWQTCMITYVESARGTCMVLYVVIMLFGLFHLDRHRFLRCAALVFTSFVAINVWEVWHGQVADPRLAVLQVCALFAVLAWLSIYASYVQATRQRMRQRRYALQAHQDTLRGMMRQLEDLVATDELTGLFNRRHFLRLASRELASLAKGRQHGLALIDLDHFKRINDAHGHAAGDQVLQTFASVATACLRDGDVLARYGGEEFVLLLLDSNADDLTLCCERLRLAFASAQPLGLQTQGLSLSAGMTLLLPGDDLDDALHRADQALYRAKRSGRNRCAAAWEPDDA